MLFIWKHRVSKLIRAFYPFYAKNREKASELVLMEAFYTATW